LLRHSPSSFLETLNQTLPAAEKNKRKIATAAAAQQNEGRERRHLNSMQEIAAGLMTSGSCKTDETN
jgi:hypothetical protein